MSKKLFSVVSVVLAVPLTTWSDVVFENARMRLVVGDDAKVASLVVKATGEEMVASGERLPLMTAEQDRPYHNEVRLVHPNKRVVYPAKAVRRDGDTLTVDFDREPFSAEFRVRLTDDYLAFEFVRIVFDRLTATFASSQTTFSQLPKYLRVRSFSCSARMPDRPHDRVFSSQSGFLACCLSAGLTADQKIKVELK